MALDYGQIHFSDAANLYVTTAGTGGTESKEDREKRMTDYELSQLHREREAHKNTMDRERQQQDFQLAMMARQCFSWVLGVGLVALFAAASILGGIWMVYHRNG